MDIFDDIGSSEDSSVSSIRDDNQAFLDKCSNGNSRLASSLFCSTDNTDTISRSLNPNSTRLRAVISELLLRGATISPALDQHVTHVVVDFEYNHSISKEKDIKVRQYWALSSHKCQLSFKFLRRDQARLRELRFQPTYRFEKRVVNLKWVQDCIAQEQLVIPTKAHIVKWITDDTEECI